MKSTSHKLNLRLIAKASLLGLLLCNVDVTTGAPSANRVQPVFAVETIITDAETTASQCTFTSLEPR